MSSSRFKLLIFEPAANLLQFLQAIQVPVVPVAITTERFLQLLAVVVADRLTEKQNNVALQLPPFLCCARNSVWDIQVTHQYPQVQLDRQVLRKRWHVRAYRRPPFQRYPAVII